MKPAKEIQDFINRLTAMKVEAGQLGLYRTMHALEEPQTVVGWEVAEKLGGKHVTTKYEEWRGKCS